MRASRPGREAERVNLPRIGDNPPKEISMSRTSRLTRTVLTVTAAGAAVLIGAGPAMAHHCFIPMYSLNGPKSANWFVVSAEEGAMELANGYTAPCDGGAEAGYAALRENKMPVGIKIKVSMTIGDPKD